MPANFQVLVRRIPLITVEFRLNLLLILYNLQNQELRIIIIAIGLKPLINY